MNLPDLTELTVAELLTTHSAVLDELRHRNVIRSKNNPTGDYAEWLVSTMLGLTLEKIPPRGLMPQIHRGCVTKSRAVALLLQTNLLSWV